MCPLLTSGTQARKERHWPGDGALTSVYVNAQVLNVEGSDWDKGFVMPAINGKPVFRKLDTHGKKCFFLDY